MKHAVITLASVTAALVALDMSSSTVTWANNSDGTLTYVEKTPEAGWNNVPQTLAPGLDNETTPATLDASPMNGSLTYTITEESDHYEFDIILEGASCSTRGTMSCKPVDGTSAPNRLCGTDGKGPTVYEVTATPTLETDNISITCNVDVQNLGDNADYVPHVKKLTLEHVQFLNWNSSQKAPGMIETFTSPQGDHYIAVAETGTSGLIHPKTAKPQVIYIYSWDGTEFKLNTTIPAVSGQYVSAMNFYTTLANKNVEYFQVAYTYATNDKNIGRSRILGYYFDHNPAVNTFVLDKDRSSSPTYAITGRNGISDLQFFEDTAGPKLLVVESGNEYTGFNQRSWVYNWNAECSCFSNSSRNASTYVNTYGALSVDAYTEDGKQFFSFANEHNHQRYNLDNYISQFTTAFANTTTTPLKTFAAKDWAHFTVAEDAGYTYLVQINGMYDLASTTPSAPSHESLVYKSTEGAAGLSQPIKDLPLYVRSWEAVALEGKNYFFVGYSKDPGDEDKRKEHLIYNWCTTADVAENGNWCKGNQGQYLYAYPSDYFTIPENASSYPLTFDWKHLEIDGETYLVRIDNTKTGTNTTQVLKASLK